MSARSERNRMLAVLLLLVTLQFALLPKLGDRRIAPDFLIIALLVYCIRSRPGNAAVAGFLLGILSDSLTPARFGAGALANTVVGYVAAWGRAVFFADNLLVNAGLFAVGLWLRNLIMDVASGGSFDQMVMRLGVWSSLQALTTAVAGVLILVIFRRWLAIRLE